ncbi:Maintenance of ploidy protein mob2 [Lobulomyces angularis]|nr:Maintenance of ploidy protein mob2 [Lobulomyces angularis]
MKEPYISGTLVNGSLKILVTLPKFVDLNEWLAVNTFDFFFYGNLFFGAVAEFCTVKDCPIMSSGPGFEYTWTDSQKKTIKLPGPQYIDYVMTWIQNLIDDESIFPTKAGIEFQKDFQIQIKVIYKQLFRVFAHIYYAHYEKILNLSAEGHLNTLFAHFVCFAKEFDLLDRKEMAPMNDFIVELEASGRI